MSKEIIPTEFINVTFYDDESIQVSRSIDEDSSEELMFKPQSTSPIAVMAREIKRIMKESSDE